MFIFPLHLPHISVTVYLNAFSFIGRRISMLVAACYILYLGSCAALIGWLSFTFHRSGSILLREAFRGDETLVRAVTHLLDIGFYLVGLGYVVLTQEPWGWQVNLVPTGTMILMKLGWFLLFMGFVHLFNLLLLAIFRRRTLVANPTLSTPPPIPTSAQ
jgi:hypothetical protein